MIDCQTDVCCNHIRSLLVWFPNLDSKSPAASNPSSTAHTVETAFCNTKTPRTLRLHAHGSILGSGKFTNKFQFSDWLLDPILEAPIFPPHIAVPDPETTICTASLFAT